MHKKSFEWRALNIKRSRNGIPCFWSSTKDFENMSRTSYIFTNDLVEKTEQLFTKKSGERLVPIIPEDYILKIFKEKDESGQTCFGVSFLKVVDISRYGNKATIDVVLRKDAKDNDFYVNETYNDSDADMIMGVIRSKLKDLQ